MADPVFRNTLVEARYSIDYVPGGDPDAATWYTIPILLIRQNESIPPREVNQEEVMINGVGAGAGKIMAGALAIAIRDSDTFLTVAKAAEDQLTPTWVWLKYKSQNARIIGGDNGCIVQVNADAGAQFGTFAVNTLLFATSGNIADDAFEIVTGSGS